MTLQPEQSVPRWIAEHPRSFLGMVRPTLTGEEEELDLRTLGSVVALLRPTHPGAIASEEHRVDSTPGEASRCLATPDEVEAWKRTTIQRHLDDTQTTARHDRLYRLVRADLDAIIAEALTRWPGLGSAHLAEWLSIERAHRRGFRHRYGSTGRLSRYAELVDLLDRTPSDDPIVARLRLDHRSTEPEAL